MKQTKDVRQIGVFLLFFLACMCCSGVEETNVIALGDWSEPVGNEYGCKLRGRLAMCAYPEHRGPANRVDVGVYVELQEYSDSMAGGVQVYCDFMKGLKCEVADANGRAPEPVGTGYDGGVPSPVWVCVPPFASIRLRASVDAGGRLRDGSLGLWFAGAGQWTIKRTDTNTYFMSATFTVTPPPGTTTFNNTQIWSGTLHLPKMKLPR